ncbi:MAG: hypothetical protein HZA50_15035 [Planctomycetes bacterium]|nr:hypothetical protein [Planctomycetota bacterium]
MTTIDGYQGIGDLLARLKTVARRRWAARTVRGLAATVVILAGSIVLVGLAAGYWPDQPPQLLRWGLLVAVCAGWAAAFFWLIAMGFFWRQNMAQTARFVEQNLPQARNDLINSLLLAGDSAQPSRELVQQAINEAMGRARRLDLAASVPVKPAKKWALACLAVLGLAGAFAALQPKALARGITAVFHPSAYVAAANSLELASLEPSDTTRFAGQPLTIIAKIRNETGRPLAGSVIIEGADQPRAMIVSDNYTVFSCPMGVVDQTFRYAVKIGDSRWPADKPWFCVNVIKQVSVEGLDIKYDYPAYTRLGGKKIVNAEGNIEAPMGSMATVTLRLSAAVPDVALEERGGRTQILPDSDGGRVFTGRLAVNADGAYRLLLRDSTGGTIQQLPDTQNGNHKASAWGPGGSDSIKGYYRIRAVPDAPPKVEILVPGRDVTAGATEKLPLRIKASDDYGISNLELWAGLEGAPPQKIKGFAPPASAPARPSTSPAKDDPLGRPIDFAMDLSAYKINDTVVYYAVAADNRNLTASMGPQTASSVKYKVAIRDMGGLDAQKAKLQEELRRRLTALLHLQETQIVNTGICSDCADLEKIHVRGGEILTGQQAVKNEIVDLAEKFPFEKEMLAIQMALADLAANDAPTAVEQAKIVSALPALHNRDRACLLLVETQTRILDAIQTMLAIMPSLAKKPDEKKAATQPGNLPPEVAAKLTELKNDLKAFMDDQKKIIKASEELAKKPVDNFNAADEKLLKELQLSQEKWEKFLNEAVTDFSKLTQQDFSNPAMLKELMAVKSDVTMAKDALSKKAVEIATACEDNGIENAKELMANIEKWLPDEPDRQKWSMEDPAGQMNTEQAALPTELEDLVGDLLEQEEDLFEEMDDLSGKYNQSGDKGIGWDAMDGPISNQNAQGVTGNQLPNSDELQGRSGEGRQGKSSGEYVEDKAVGKGGRRTPTRLTPEPFQKGQVDDKTTEAEGGSTGGGKVSGQGGEGLEGPVPPPLANEMKRLAGKQADLLNKAQRVAAGMKTSDYSSFKMLQAITLMNRVKSDLENNRYQNVLRSKQETVGALKDAQDAIAGKIDVTSDTSSAMPKHVRQDISDAMKGNLPDEYKDVLEEYHRKLSQQGQK